MMHSSTGNMEGHFPAKELLCPGLTIYLRINAGKTTCLSLVDLDVISNLLGSQEGRDGLYGLLSEQERHYSARFQHHKRLREWLGGRLTAKCSGLQLLCPEDSGQKSVADLTILAEKSGRPVLQTEPMNMRPGISISHSNQFAVGMAVTSPACGVDIQEITSRILGLTERFAAKEEINILHTLIPEKDRATRLTMLWAAKEALKKSILHDQPSIFQGILLKEVRYDPNTFSWTFLCRCSEVQVKPFRLHVIPMDNYILAVTEQSTCLNYRK